MTSTVWLVPHTHWDREWYEPFQRFRLRLVDLMDDVVARAARVGPVMPIGYLPDMFGHCAQMPQILRHVGIDQAVVYRGVPAEVDRHEFWWRSPDGTGIRTEFLANSYGNVADVFGGGAARQRLATRLATQTAAYGEDF